MVTITPPDAQTHNAGDTVSLTVAASGSGTLRFSATGLPNGLTIHPRSGVISGILHAGGVFQSIVTATNGSTSASAAFTWSVASPMTLTDAAGQIVQPAAAAVVMRVVPSNENDPPSCSATVLPPGIRLNGSGCASGTVGSGGLSASTHSGDSFLDEVATRSALPRGLTINPSTGVISGSIRIAPDSGG